MAARKWSPALSDNYSSAPVCLVVSTKNEGVHSLSSKGFAMPSRLHDVAIVLWKRTFNTRGHFSEKKSNHPVRKGPNSQMFKKLILLQGNKVQLGFRIQKIMNSHKGFS